MSNETQIRGVLDELTAAAKSKDLDRLMRCYARDVVEFDVMPPLQSDFEKTRSNWKMCFDMTEGPVGYDLSKATIIADDELAMAYGLSHFVADDKKDHKHNDFWIRFTAGFKKVDGTWKIVHEHDSFPIDMETNKPRMDLKPS
jgi:ketosteroid isomerase-like protein